MLLARRNGDPHEFKPMLAKLGRKAVPMSNTGLAHEGLRAPVNWAAPEALPSACVARKELCSLHLSSFGLLGVHV